jgi:hypothetical protein
VSPAPIGPRRLAALAGELAGDVEVTQFYGGTVDDIVAAAVAADATVIALDCAPGIDPDALAAATPALVLRPAYTTSKNRRGQTETDFSHYVRIPATTAA